MSVLHASYGLGAFAAPLVSTQFSQQKRWSFHYLISMGIAFASLVMTVGVFRLKRQDGQLKILPMYAEQVIDVTGFQTSSPLNHLPGDHRLR